MADDKPKTTAEYMANPVLGRLPASDGLVAFLRERLDEDQQRAESEKVLRGDDPYYQDEATAFERRFDPVRVLAEVDAKRHILGAWPDSFGLWSADQADAAKTMKAAVLLLLAVPYDQHLDYDERWRP